MKINPNFKILGNKIKITPKFKYINHNLVLNLIFLREDNIIFIALVNIILRFNSIVKPKWQHLSFVLKQIKKKKTFFCK